MPRRTLYLMSVRTGTPSDFGRLFDLPDCGQIVEKRNVSTVAPQARAKSKQARARNLRIWVFAFREFEMAPYITNSNSRQQKNGGA